MQINLQREQFLIKNIAYIEKNVYLCAQILYYCNNMDFHYEPMFQLGKDETEYYLLTKDHVSVAEFSLPNGNKVPLLLVEPEGLTKMAQQAFHNVSFIFIVSGRFGVAQDLGYLFVVGTAEHETNVVEGLLCHLG